MQRRRLIIFVAASALVIATAAQAKQELNIDAAQGANFNNYKTYTWVKTHPSGGIDSVHYQRILGGLDSRLASKGYRKGSPADLTIALTLGKQQKVDVDAWTRYGYHVRNRSYTEGQISVDAFDTKTKKALWHGQITDSITPGKPNYDKLNSALAKLMEHFPATTKH